MEIGKSICRQLKMVRMKIASANDIEYTPSECHHKGECAGTCPRCEYEVKYLEHQLNLRRAMGKAVSLVGVGMGITAVTSCGITHIFHQTAGMAMDPPKNTLASKDSTECRTTGEINTTVIHSDTLANDLLMGDVVETQPCFPGGDQALTTYLAENLRWPSEKNKRSGRVVVSFYVEADGSITGVEVMRSLSEEYDAEAVRVVKTMPKWEPGSINGKNTRVRYVLPVKFDTKH